MDAVLNDYYARLSAMGDVSLKYWFRHKLKALLSENKPLGERARREVAAELVNLLAIENLKAEE